MEMSATDLGTGPSVNQQLPACEQLARATRPQTCESSATTVPPTDLLESGETCNRSCKVPPAGLLSSLRILHENSDRQREAPKKETGPFHVPVLPQPAEKSDKPGNQNAPQVELAVQPVVGKGQRRKRPTRPQPRKVKRPRLGPTQATLKNRGRPKGRKNNAAKERQISSSSQAYFNNKVSKDCADACSNGKEKPVSNGKIVTVSKEKTLADAMSSTEAEGEKKSERRCQQSSATKSKARILKLNLKQADEKDDRKQAITPGGEPGALSQRETQTTSCENDGKYVETDKAAASINPAGKSKKQGKDSIAKGNPGSKDKEKETNLEEKYHDLSKKYTNLVRSLVQSSPNGKPKNQNNRAMLSDESEGSEKDTPSIVDSKLYNTIYLCKIAGMLGTLNIEDGFSKFVRPCRFEGFENPYKSVAVDGFQFVEELMMVGDPDESSKASVKTVFHDLHIRLVNEAWQRNKDKENGKALVSQILVVIGDQLKEWYLKIIDSKIMLRWSGMISEEFAEPLYELVRKIDKDLATELSAKLRYVLQEISRQYQEAEKDIDKVSLEKFCNSCEVSICVARSMPEAALSLEEEEAFAIGRHNGVFSYCVARLQAERDEEQRKSV